MTDWPMGKVEGGGGGWGGLDKMENHDMIRKQQRTLICRWRVCMHFNPAYLPVSSTAQLSLDFIMLLQRQSLQVLGGAAPRRLVFLAVAHGPTTRHRRRLGQRFSANVLLDVLLDDEVRSVRRLLHAYRKFFGALVEILPDTRLGMAGRGMRVKLRRVRTRRSLGIGSAG